MVKTFSPERVAGDARFDGKFHTPTKAGWSPCTGWRNLPISSLDHHSLLKQSHRFQALPITSSELRVVHMGTGRSFSEASFQEHQDTVVMLHSWMASAQKSLRSCAPSGVQRNPVSFWLTKSREPRDPFDIFQPQEGDKEETIQSRRDFLAVSLPSLKPYL